MFRSFLLFFAVLLFICKLQAQQLIPMDELSYLNKIESNIKSNPNINNRLYNYLLLSEFWSQTDTLKSKKALDFVLLSPDREILPKGVLEYYQGVFYSSVSEKNKSKMHYQDAISLLEADSSNTDLLVKALYNLAYLQVADEGYESMVKILTERCIPLSKKNGNNDLLAFSYTQLGLTFMSVGQFETADEYHKKALSVLAGMPVENTVHLLTYLNIVSNYCYIPDSKSAKIYLEKARDIIEQYPGSKHYPNFYYQEAMYFTTVQDYALALNSLESGVRLARENNQAKLLHMLYFRMYNVYLMQKNYNEAKSQLEYILKENILSQEPVNRRVTYTQLAAVNELMGNHKEAYEWMKKSSVLNDSLQKQKILEKMHELEILHQTSEKKQRIDSLEQEKKEATHLAKNKNLRIAILGIALGLCLIIAFLIFLNYKNQIKLNKQISLSHEQDLKHIEKERKHEATKAVLQGEEQERQRIAQDLHDSMGGMLANIRMSISSLDPHKTTDIYDKIDKSLSEMRRISRNLMPETLKNLGLEIAMRELCESMSHKNFYIQFEEFNLSKNIPFQIQLVLYRIVQECISNIIKYAQANNVIVQISQNNKTINLTVEDDGIGFDKTEVVYGLGLKNIENRVRLINGSLDINSSVGEGTTINVECYV